MKNVFLLPTDKPSRLILHTNGKLRLSIIVFRGQVASGITQHINITSDEEIKVDDWYYLPRANSVYKCIEDATGLNLERRLWGIGKIILTTDQDLIKDGVQAIDDEFLQWYVNNPGCEYVEIDKNWNYPLYKSWEYKIIIPKEEPKTYTVDDYFNDEFPKEKRYSVEDMIEAAKYGYNFHKTTAFPNQEFKDSCVRNTQQWLTTYKNK